MPKKGEKSGVYIKCEYCGKEVYKTKSQYLKAEHHFCSNKCQKLKLHNETYEDRQCIMCKKTFNVPIISEQLLCSINCQKEWQKTRIGILNPRFTSQEVTCDICGKSIFVKPYKIKKGQKNFCSNECRRLWYATDFSKRDSWVEECRVRSASLMKDSIIVNTKPQVIVNNLLDELNINYINEKNFDYYSVDNFLNDYNLIIEVNGDFWHSNPIKYPNYKELANVQLKRIPKDKAKRTYLRNKGIEILYLWESDIYSNLILCKLLILKFIASKGKLCNYNSFNYTVIEEQLKIKKDIIYPYFENHIINA